MIIPLYFRRILERLRHAQVRDMPHARVADKLTQLVGRSAPIKLDLDAGGPGHPGTIGVDLNPGADLVWDLTQGIPCQDSSVTAIFSDHFLEHLPLVDIVRVLKECRRVLISGGRLRFTVPHIDPYIDAWLKGDAEFIASKITDVPQDQEALYAAPFDRISWLLLRDGEHKAIFDRESISHKVRLAGFGWIRTSFLNPAVDRNPGFFSVEVEVIK